jgi:hypothetical protein
MAWLALAYPLIFQEKAENPPSGDKPTDGGRRQSPWIKVFDGLVGDDLINRDRYAELPVHTVLRFMTEKSKERMRK